MGISHLVIGNEFRPNSPIERDFAEGLGHFSLWMREHRVSVSMQEPIGPYRADFVLRMPGQAPLVVECDGRPYHSSPAQRERDAKRDAYMARITLRVLHRITGSALHWVPTACARLALMTLSGLGESVVENCGDHTQQEQEIRRAEWASQSAAWRDDEDDYDPEDGYSHDEEG